MSNDAATEEPTPEWAEADAAPPKPDKRRKLLMIAIALLLLLGAGGGAAWWFLGGPAEEDKLQEVAEAPETFVDVPPIQVSLRGADGSSRTLKLHVMLVPEELSPEEITARLPLLLDRYQPFLRELRPEDLSGSAATFRIKEELLIRANQALGPKAVRDVLIQDLMA